MTEPSATASTTTGQVAPEFAYDQLHRAGAPGAWRSVVGSLLLFVWLIIGGSAFLLIPFLAWFVLSGQTLGAGLDEIASISDPTPVTLAYLNLTIASVIPMAFIVSVLLHRLRPGWLTSVAPRMRWRYFAACLPLSAVALGATLLVSVVFPSGEAGAEVGGDLNPVTSTMIAFIVVIVLLTPLQAAGEEYLFRGYLTQACGRVGGRVLAVVGPAVLFALAHGATQSAPIFVDRLAFGLMAGVLVIVTGGLEAVIAMHVLNNFAAYGLTLAFGDMAGVLQPTGGSWWMLPSTLTQTLLYLALAWGLARWWELRTTTPRPALVGAL